MTYCVITIDRNKTVVRSTAVNTWAAAVSAIGTRMHNARAAKWAIFPKGTWDAPRSVKGLNGGRYTTSFGMAKRTDDGQSEYFFTYIKKAE